MNFICRFCQDERINANSLRNHERLCKLNPNRQIAELTNARAKANSKVSCEFCNKEYSKANIKKHTNACIKNPLVQENYAQCVKKYFIRNQRPVLTAAQIPILGRE